MNYLKTLELLGERHSQRFSDRKVSSLFLSRYFFLLANIRKPGNIVRYTFTISNGSLLFSLTSQHPFLISKRAAATAIAPRCAPITSPCPLATTTDQKLQAGRNERASEHDISASCIRRRRSCVAVATFATAETSTQFYRNERSSRPSVRSSHEIKLNARDYLLRFLV